jgi:N-methylhydantoinase B
MTAYHRPDSLTAALAIRAREEVTILAGGTDVYPAAAARAGWGDSRCNGVLDISAIALLRGIAEHADHWRIGALTTWSDLLAARLPPLFDGCKRAAREIGGQQIQNRGTLVGNLCTASAAGDGAPNLLALDASVELASMQGCRQLPLSAFITGNRRTGCRGDEIVTAIRVPKQGRDARGHFLKLGARSYLVIAIVMVAGVVDTDQAGTIRSARIAVGACSAVAQRLTALEAMLAGLPLAGAAARVAAEHVEPLTPIDDIRGSAAYRRRAALVLTRDLLCALAQGGREGAD